MMDIITNPVGAIAQAKTEKNLSKPILATVVAAVLLAIATVVFGVQALGRVVAVTSGGPLAGLASMAGMVALVVAAVVLAVMLVVGVLIAGYILARVMNILGGAGGLAEGVASFSYPLLIISVAILVGSVLSFIPWVGGLLGGVVLMVLGAIGIATMFRAIKDLFGAQDYITVLVAFAVLCYAAMLAVYFGLISMFISMPVPIMP